MRASIIQILTIVLLIQTPARAESPATARALRNAQGAIANVKLIPALRDQPIAQTDVQTAKNLLRDIDYAVKRAGRELASLQGPDAELPEAVELKRQLAELEAFGANLKKNIEGQAVSAAALDKLYRDFRTETARFAPAVGPLLPLSDNAQAKVSATAEQIAAWRASLEELDGLCRSKYPNIPHDDRLAFQLNIAPARWCAVADKRVALTVRVAEDAVRADLIHWLKIIVEDKKTLEQRQGLIGSNGAVVDKLLEDRDAGKADLAAKYKPYYELMGRTMSPEFWKPVDAAIDELFAEIDRLALTWTWPDVQHHDGALEAAFKKFLPSRIKGASVLKTGMVESGWTIAKNALGIPLSRYRTGIALYKAPGAKWCQYRQFTRVEQYSGGGNYEKSDGFNLGAFRHQKCP